MRKILFFAHKNTSRLRHCHIFSTAIPFPEIGVTDVLRQAASDIISILTRPPSTITLSLAADNLVRNTLLTLATQLKRIEPIPEP